MIRVAAPLDPPAPRLLALFQGRSELGGTSTLVLGAGCSPDRLESSLAETPDARLLVVSALGVHPDARAPRLRALWDLEEQARGSGRPVLTLRLAPMLGPRSPLWLRLRSQPRLPEPDQTLLNPVAESDVVETLARALEGRAHWEGWYEVAGDQAITLGELAVMAARSPRLPDGSGEWEPPHLELREHRLAEAGPWSTHFGVTPSDITSGSATWS